MRIIFAKDCLAKILTVAFDTILSHVNIVMKIPEIRTFEIVLSKSNDLPLGRQIIVSSEYRLVMSQNMLMVPHLTFNYKFLNFNAFSMFFFLVI